MKTDILKEIGLTDSEIKVYLTLLELGDSSRSNIVNKSGVAGSKIYELLERLQKKGLVSIYIKNKIKHFKPTNPNQILNYLEEKKRTIEEAEKQTKLLIPKLLSKFNLSKEDQEVELISGLKGLEIIFREQIEMLHKGETCFVIGGTRGINEGPIQIFFQKIHVMREKKLIKTKMLFNKIQKDTIQKYYSAKKYPHTKTKYIEHTSPVAINIYRDRTVIIIFSRQITSIHIKSREVANSFLEHFNILWKQATN